MSARGRKAKVFISFSFSDAEMLAEDLLYAIRANEHEVLWFGRNERVGHEYQAAIPKAIRDSDILIFLISPDALREDCYCRAELEIAKREKPNPANRVLTALLRGVRLEQLPPYLRANTVRTDAVTATTVAHDLNALAQRLVPPSSIDEDEGITCLTTYEGEPIEARANRPVTTTLELLHNGQVVARRDRPSTTSIVAGIETLVGGRPVWTVSGQITIKGVAHTLRADFVTTFTNQFIRLYVDGREVASSGS